MIQTLDFELRIVDHKNAGISSQIHTIQQAAYTLESQLISYPNLPPLRQTITDIQTSLANFLACFTNGKIVGILVYEIFDNNIDITSLTVAPTHFRQGIANQLLTHLEAKHPKIPRFTVSTAKKNKPAIRLYKKHQFIISAQHRLPDAALRALEGG